jgi:site-specific recombinase XerC
VSRLEGSPGITAPVGAPAATGATARARGPSRPRRPLLELEVTVYPEGRNPAAVVLERYAPGASRRTARQCLESIAWLASGGQIPAARFPWHRLDYAATSKLRDAMRRRWAPRGVNLRLAILRAVLRVCWRLEYMTGEEKERAIDVPSIPLSTKLRGRELDRGEIGALLESCARDRSPAGARDAGILGLLYAAGLRAQEVADLDLASWNPTAGELDVQGKGRKHRRAWARGGLALALEEWVAVRGRRPGPLFFPVDRRGKIGTRRLSPQASRWVCQKRAASAGVAHFSPHDLRRSFVSHLLEAGEDLSIASALAGHAGVETTAAYDRRGEDARRRAAEKLHLPYPGRRCK